MHYIESICEAEKWACNTLQGLFDTLSAKFWLQFNETIKLLQFRKLCRVEDESAEEWMGHLCMAAAECGYKEIDQQLKEQFIHRLNDRVMLDEIIRELTSKTNSEQTTSKDVLAWAKRVKAQSMQASVLNDITETKTFDKIKNAPESKNTWGERIKHCNTPEMAMQVLWGRSHTQTMPSIWKNMHCMWQDRAL